MSKINSGLKGLVLLVIASSALFLTCDVGLGDSVDTKPPAVTITYPPVQSIIKNAFTMSGAASDDTALASVTVSMVNTVTSAVYGPYAGTIDPTTASWSLVVNNPSSSGFEIRDGTYEMTVTALDGAGRKTVATTTYEIDNTAPVVVIDRPGTYGPLASQSPEVYGKELKLTGSINDDHAIDKLVFTAYDPSGNIVGAPITQTNISGVAMDITLARYSDAPTTAEDIALNDTYRSIYTVPDGDTQSYYCTVTVSDTAREYNPPAAIASADNSRGNVNKAYYIYDDIYSTIFSATGYAVTMKDLTAMFNGSYSDAAKSAAVLGVLATKSRQAAAWSTSSATFSLNSKNNPSYEVKGFSPISAANPIDGMKKTNATDLTILVQAGRDGVPLIPDGFRVYLDPCGASGDVPVETAGADDIVLLPTVAELTSNYAPYPDASTAIAARNLKLTKSGNDYSVFVNIGTLATKQNYLLRVTGSDQNSKTLDEKNYGFRVITNGKPPVITIDDGTAPTPDNLSTINSTSVTLKGTVTSETGLVSMPATVEVKPPTGPTVTYTVNPTVTLPAIATTPWTMSINSGADTTTTGLYQYTVTLTATDEEGNSTIATRIFYIDREPPTVEFNEPTPTVSVAGTPYVNGKVKFTGRVTDNVKVASASYSINGGPFMALASPSSWTVSDIDTTNYDDIAGVGTLTLTVNMVDGAGNISSSAKSISIDQATDKPVITLTNVDVTKVLPGDVSASVNLLGTTSNNKILGTITDDDKLGTTMTVKVDGTAADPITIMSPGTSYNVYYTPTVSGAALSEGTHTIEIIATDDSGVTTTTGAFCIGMDAGDPSLAVTSPAQNGFYSGTITVSGSATDGSGVVTLVRKGSPDTAITVNAGTGLWNDSLNVGTTTGSFTKTYEATDKYGRTKTATFSYTVDATPPTLTVSTPAGPTYAAYIKKENVYQIIGGAADVGSTVSAVMYKALPALTTAPVAVDGSWSTAVGTTNWVANVNLADNGTYPEGDYRVYVASKDSADNYSTISSVLLHADKDSPALNVTTTPAAFLTGTIGIGGNASDTNIDAVTYSRTATNAGTTVSGPLTLIAGAWSINDVGLADDTYSYTITATDRAGRVTTRAVQTVKDSAAPTIEISSITKQISANSRDDNVNGVITVKGTISDNDKVQAGTYTLTSNGSDVSGFVNQSVGSNLTSWQFTVDTATTAGITDGQDLVIKINATDRAGNPATMVSQTVHVDQSTDKPTIVLSNANVLIVTSGGVTSANNLFDTSSNKSILGTVTDDDKLGTSIAVKIDGVSVAPISISSPGTTYSLSYEPKVSGASLSEGIHSIEFIASDEASVTSTTGPFYIGIDNGAPLLAITSPGQNDYCSGTITVSGNASDGSGVVTLVRKGSPDTPVTVTAGSWNDLLNVGTTTGLFTKTYTATDKYGKTTSATFSYKVDADAPSVIITTPTSYLKKENVFQVAGTASDVGSSVSAVMYKAQPAATAAPTGVDGSWVAAVGTTSWTASVNLSDNGIYPEGDYRIYVASKDLASNYSSISSVLFHADKDSPTLNVTAAPSAFLTGTIAIGGNVSDTNLDAVAYSRTATNAGTTVNGTLTLTAGAWSINDVGLADDTYAYTITATDKAGRVTTQALQTVKDSVAPVIEISSVTKQVSANSRDDNVNRMITVKGTISDNDKVQAGTYTLTSNGSPVTGFVNQSVGANLTSWQFTVDTTIAGIPDAKDLVITINATDRAGNPAVTKAQTVHVDQSTDKPIITLTAPAANSYVTASYVVRGTATDDDGIGTDKIEIRYDNGTAWSGWLPISTNGGTVTGSTTEKAFTFTLPALGADGAKQVEVRAYDTDGYMATPISSGAIPFSIDTTDPAPSFTSPAVDDTAHNSSFILSCSVVEAGLDTLKISIDGGAKTTLITGGSGTQSQTYDLVGAFTSLSQGRHTATLEAVDKVGRSASAQRVFYKDTTGPTINFSNLTIAASPATAVLTPESIKGSVSDTYSSLATIFTYRFDTDPAGDWRTGSILSSTWDVPIPSDLTEGAHTITVQCADSLGNSTPSAAVGFRLDRNIPTITFTPPVTTLYNADYSVNGSSSDANGIATIECYVDDVLKATQGSSWSYTVGAGTQTAGGHTLKIVATDGVGRTSQTVFSYTVDLTAPVATITGITPLADTSKLNGSVTIAASGTDANGIDGYAYATTNTGVTDPTTILAASWTAFAASSTTISFDTTNGGANTWEDTTRRVWVRAQDKASNYGYAYEDHVVDQDSDKPVVKLTNLATTGSPTLVQTKVIYGSLSDDDGSVTSLAMKNSSSDSWIPVTLDGQSFTYTVTGLDGAKQLYFQITDKAGSTFNTAAASSATTPRLYQSVNTYLETPLSFNLDTTPPDIGSDSIGIKVASDAAYRAYSSTNAYYGGSSSGSFNVQFMASSANTVASATVSVTDSASTTKSVAATLGTPVSVTADISADTLTASASHGLTAGTRVFFTGTTLPGGLTANVPYYVISTGLTLTAFEVSATSGGSAIDITAAGSSVYFTTGWTTSSAIDITTLASGAATLSISTADTPGLSTTTSKTILIDNVKPSISVTSHSMNEQVTGDVVFNGTSDDGTGSGVTVVKYHVGKCADLNATTWTTLSTQLSWAINFTSAASNVITTTATYANSTYATETSAGSNVWILPIYLRAVDKAGNVQDYTYYLNVDPNGDKPTASISYPASGTTLGGNIRIFGSATDNVSVASVWMEIDTNNDGAYNAADIAALVAAGYGTAPALADGFKIDGTASWSKTINGSGEFNAPGTVVPATTITKDVRYKIVTVDGTDYVALGATGNTPGVEFTANASGALSAGTGTVSALTNLIQFRVCACDNNGTYGTWSGFRTIKIDNKAPKIGSSTPLKLVQYTDGTLTTVAAEQSYVSNMYIRGEWYLVGSVEDESGIKTIAVSGSATGTLSTQPSWFVKGTAVGSYFNYTFRIPVGKALSDTSCGAQTYTVYVEDASDPTGTTTQSISLNYDNKAPVLVPPTHGGTPVSTSNLVVQSNNTYTFSATVTEDGSSDSGFNRLVFFFERQKTDGSNKRIYNPMLPVNGSQTAGDVTGNRTYLSNLTWDAGDVPRLAITGATRSGEDRLTHTSIQGNYNVRVGGLVRIAGVDRLIKSVDRTAGTITFSPSVSTSYTDASLLYGLVVDNTVVEVGVWSGSTLSSITNDDGDGMIESVVKSGGTWTWDASVDSKNIPDGPIYLYYVAYDKAGNTKSGYVQSSVANSGPRIAKIQLGTDLSGDGAFNTSEVSTVYTATSGSEPTSVNLTDKTFKMKGDLAVIPEFVGGNGTLEYVWTANASGATVWDGSTYRTTKATTSEGTLTPFPGVTVSGTSYAYGLTLLAANTNVVAMNGALKLLSFTVWDSTDETTIGTDSQWALINVPINVAVTDTTVPNAIIDPFFWASLASNSIYGTSTSTTDPSTLTGHIELPADLSTATFPSSNTSGEYDRDPKVSGKITITGSAYDDQRLDSLWVTFDGFTPTVGTYLATRLDVGDSKTYYKMASFNTGTSAWTYAATIPTMATNSYTFTVTPDYLTQAGHRVTWKLCIDTAKITNSAAADARVRVVAYDHGSLPSPYNTVTPGTNVPYYQMDVVPYIKGVKTSLSTLKKTLSSVYDRTALGHYPVKSDLNAYFYGFNLAATATVSDSAAHTATLGAADTSTYSGYTVYPVAVSTFSSGSVSVTVGTVVSLNNQNTNDAKGSYTGTTSAVTGDYGIYSNYYNRQPNNDNNNTLSDDIVLDVWKVKNSARSHSGTLTEPIMRIVPTAADTASTGDVMRFAFTNGADYFSMASALSNTNSYQDWQRNYADFNNVAFTYDSEGNSYGITTGLDTYPNGTTTFAGRLTFISSRWGVCNTGSMDDNYYGFHKLRLEAIGIMQGANVQGTALTDSYIMDTRRFNSPVLATAVHGAGTGTNASTSVYFAYFDKFQNQIRFRYGTFDTTVGTPTQAGTTHNAAGSGGFNQFLDQHAQADTNGGAGYRDTKYAFDAALADYSLIAGKSATATPVDTGNAPGKYVAIDVVPGATAADDVVVAVWYNGSDLKYSYKLNPYTDNDADQAHASSSGYWSTPITIFTDGGKYCAVKVDPAGGIHIAAQDNSNQDLKYAYLATYGAGYTESSGAVTVDAYAIVGSQIQIDTQTESGKVIPYISYYNGSTMKPKMAYLVPQTTMDYAAAGADPTTEMLTGKWEVTVVPTASEVQDDHMNIGLWKTTAGVKRANVQTGTDSIASATGYSYGNGTANPVVGYATVAGTQGYIETAQKQ